MRFVSSHRDFAGRVRGRWGVVCAILCPVLFSGMAHAQTRPADFRAPVLFGMVQRATEAVAKLELAQPQKTQVDKILSDARDRAEQLADDMQNLPAGQRPARVQPFLRNLRQLITQQLTPEQIRQFNSFIGAASPGISVTGPVMQSLNEALSNLTLSADQKRQLSDLMSESRQQIQSLRQQSVAGNDIQAQSDTVRQDVRQKLQDILTPQQFAQLAQDMNARVGETPLPPPRPAAKPPVTHPSYPDVGAAAPDFQLADITGRTVSFSDFKGRRLILEFGSITTPTFRDQAHAIERLRDRADSAVAFLLIYTREAHPQGGWEVDRNKADGFDLPDTSDLAARTARARNALNSLQIGIPTAIDSMTYSVADAFGLFPNGAVVIESGKIVARQQWVNADGLAPWVSSK